MVASIHTKRIHFYTIGAMYHSSSELSPILSVVQRRCKPEDGQLAGVYSRLKILIRQHLPITRPNRDANRRAGFERDAENILHFRESS